MNTYTQSPLRPGAAQRGFTLVELMVTVAIALFLLGGLVTIVQNVRIANMNQTRLAQLQDEQRFAMTVIADAVQAGGYFADPTTQSNSAIDLPVAANPAPTNPYAAGSPFAGSHTVGALDTAALDTIATRFQTGVSFPGGPVQGPILCDGTDTSQKAADTWSIQFSLQAIAGVSTLMCTVSSLNGTASASGGAAVPLVPNVVAMAIYYGVKRDFTLPDYNVDTYVTWDKMSVLNGANDYLNVSAVRIVLTFANPLFPQAGQQPTITMERVVEVMNRAGLHT
jgi:type IV pilus assembly protein PilW